jgi:hypothetical protein
LVKDAIVAALPRSSTLLQLRTTSGSRSSLRQRSIEVAEASQRRHQSNSGRNSILRTPSSTMPIENKRQLSDEGKKLLSGTISNGSSKHLTKASVLYVGGFLTKRSRGLILSRIPTIYNNVVCEHVTLEFGPGENTFEEKYASLIGNIRVFQMNVNDYHNDRVSE